MLFVRAYPRETQEMVFDAHDRASGSLAPSLCKTALTQVGRSLRQLGIEHIAASPQARGRSERVFQTLQDRLPKAFKLAGIDSVESATFGFATSFIPEHNKRFAFAAEQEGSVFVADATCAWREILCMRRKNAWWGPKIPSNETAWFCNCRRAVCGRTSSKRRCGCMPIRTVTWRCSLQRFWSEAYPGSEPERSGQIKRYENRTGSRARDRVGWSAMIYRHSHPRG